MGNHDFGPKFRCSFLVVGGRCARFFSNNTKLHIIKNETHKCIFTETNKEQFLYISGVESGDHLLLYSESYSENEVYVVCNDSVTNIFKRKNNVL